MSADRLRQIADEAVAEGHDAILMPLDLVVWVADAADSIDREAAATHAEHRNVWTMPFEECPAFSCTHAREMVARLSVLTGETA